jgi:hypothetical protein
MDKKVENLRHLVMDLESRYGENDVDVKRLQAELNLLKATRVVTNLAPKPYLHSLYKQHNRGLKATDLT